MICTSSGNAGGATATYAARAGMPAYLAVPSGAPTSKPRAARSHGATVFGVAENFSDAFAAARHTAARLGLANLTTSYVDCYTCEGDKPVAYELDEQMDRIPDWISILVSSGPLLYGVLKGFKELRTGGLVEPAAAAALAGTMAAKEEEGYIGEAYTVVCLLTGYGLKHQRPTEATEPDCVGSESELICEIRCDLGRD